MDVHNTQIHKIQIQTSYCMQNGYAYSACFKCPDIASYTTVLVVFSHYLLWSILRLVKCPLTVPLNSIKVLLRFLLIHNYCSFIFCERNHLYPSWALNYSYKILRLYTTTIKVRRDSRNLLGALILQFYLQKRWSKKSSLLVFNHLINLN